MVARDEIRLKALAEETGATFTVGDVCDPELPGKAAEDAGAPLSGLVYAVGTLNLRPFARLDGDAFERDLRVNAIGAALAVQSCLDGLRQYDGVASVVLFSSVAAIQGFSFHASIGMAKAAVSGLTLALAAELAPDVRVNAVAPSLTRTPLAEPVAGNPQMAKAVARQHPLARLGTPADVAAMVEFLLAPDSAWMTGQIVSVDGGRSTVQGKH
jgi:NAD(P)-dependent dehydrogenase (short-subunit alcohol dehydrogenase family)